MYVIPSYGANASHFELMCAQSLAEETAVYLLHNVLGWYKAFLSFEPLELGNKLTVRGTDFIVEGDLHGLVKISRFPFWARLGC